MGDTSRVKRACLILLALALAGPGGAWAQAQAPAGPRLSLSIASGAPEAETELTLKLAAPAGMPVGRVEAEVTFPAGALRFDRVGGYLVTEGFVKADTRLGDPTFGMRTLYVTLLPAKPEQPVPSDMQVDLVFTVTKETKPGVLDVGLKGNVFSPHSQPLEPVQTYDGRINIQEAEVFYACFFYMH